MAPTSTAEWAQQLPALLERTTALEARKADVDAVQRLEKLCAALSSRILVLEKHVGVSPDFAVGEGTAAKEAAEQAEKAARAKAAEEELARKKAAQEESQRKKAAADEAEKAARAKAAEEELARKKAAQEESQRKKAAADEAEKVARAKATEEELARKKAAQEESQRKKAAQEESQRKQAEDEEGEKGTPALEAADEELARKKAAQEESKRKMANAQSAAAKPANGDAAVPQASEDEQAVRARVAEEEVARKKAAQEEALRKRAAESQAAAQTASEEAQDAGAPSVEERAGRAVAAEEEAARKRLAQDEASRKMAAEGASQQAKSPDEAAAQKKAAEGEKARKMMAAMEAARRRATEKAAAAAPEQTAGKEPEAPEAATEADEKAATEAEQKAEEKAAQRKAAEGERARKMMAAMDAVKRRTAEKDVAVASAPAEDGDEAPLTAEQLAASRQRAAEEVQRRKAAALARQKAAEDMKRAAQGEAKQTEGEPRPTEEPERPKENGSKPEAAEDDEVLSASDEGSLPDLNGGDAQPAAAEQAPAPGGEEGEQPVEAPTMVPKEPMPKEKNIDYSKFDEIEDSDDEKTQEKGAAKNEEGQCDGEDDTGLRSAKNPFPDDLHAAELNMAASRGLGQEAAEAGTTMAEVLLRSAKYEESLKFAMEARKLFQEREGLEAQAMGEAGAVRLVIKALVAQEKAEEALKLAEEHVKDFSNAGNDKAAATVKLGLADAYVARERPKEALKVAKQALEGFKKLQDEASRAKTLQAMASIDLKQGTPFCLKRALQQAKEALNYFQVVGDTKEEAATLLTISKAHLLRQEFQEAFTEADKSASLCRESSNKKDEASALREVTNALIELREEHEVALQASMESLELCDEVGDPMGEIEARKILAGIYMTSGVPEMAVQTLNTALEAARELKERRQIRSVLEMVVQMNVGQGQTDKALEAVQKEARIAKSSGDLRRRLAAAQSLVSLQVGLGNQGEAVETAKEAVKFADEGSDKKVQAWAELLLAEVYANGDSCEEALDEVEKARAVFKELGDVKEVADTWQMAVGIQMRMGNKQGVLAAKKNQVLAYKDAGWRDEEAEAFLDVAELQLTLLSNPREAMKTARDVVGLMQETEDKAGEARAMLMLAQLQAEAKAYTDALSSMKAARRLFHDVGDVNGELQVLTNQSDIYYKNGRSDEAVKVLSEGRELCQKEGEHKGEAAALQAIVDMHVGAVQTEARSGRKPRPEPIEEAVAAITDLSELYRSLGYVDGQVDALIQLSGVHSINKNEAAVEVAQEALQCSIKLDQAGRVGSSLLALAEAQISQDNGKEAMEAAREAGNQFQAAGDQASYEAAMQVLEDAKQNMERPKGLAASNGGGGGVEQRSLSERMKTGGFAHRRAEAEASQAMPTMQRKQFHFGNTKAEKAYPTPNQELRRQQLQSATEASAAPPKFHAQADEPSPSAGLREVLSSVRPDWTAKDLHSVQEKLAKINVATKAELFRLLRAQGAGGVNKMLKNAGQKILKVETLQALRARADE